MSEPRRDPETIAAQVRNEWNVDPLVGSDKTHAERAVERLDEAWEALDGDGRTQLLAMVTSDLTREITFLSRNVMSLPADVGAHLLDTAGRWVQTRTREVYPAGDTRPAMAGQRHRAASFVLGLARPPAWDKGTEPERLERYKTVFDVTREMRDMLEKVPDDLREGLGRDAHEGFAGRVKDLLFELADARMELSHTLDAVYRRALGRDFKTLATVTWNEVSAFARADLSPTQGIASSGDSLSGGR